MEENPEEREKAADHCPFLFKTAVPFADFKWLPGKQSTGDEKGYMGTG